MCKDLRFSSFSLFLDLETFQAEKVFEKGKGEKSEKGRFLHKFENATIGTGFGGQRKRKGQKGGEQQGAAAGGSGKWERRAVLACGRIQHGRADVGARRGVEGIKKGLGVDKET